MEGGGSRASALALRRFRAHCRASPASGGIIRQGTSMAKGQMRGNKEAKKPKKEKPVATAAAASAPKIGMAPKKK